MNKMRVYELAKEMGYSSKEFLDMLRFGQAVDSGRARAELGLAPAPLATVIDRACAWFAKSGYLGRPAGRAPVVPTGAAS